MTQFSIDFFELMFLAESVIPPSPIARSLCFDSFSDVHYQNMTKAQRKQFFEHVQNCNGFDLNKEPCSHFYARYNPQNQFLVTAEYNGKTEEIECYKYRGKYHTKIKTSVYEPYIKKVEAIKYTPSAMEKINNYLSESKTV